MRRQNGFASLSIFLATCLGAPASALASATLKQVHTRPDGQIELEFDVPIDPDQVKTEYFRDIVQVSLTDATVYPAKIIGADTEHVTKIFAYQYSPKLVRTRFTVRTGNAETYQSAVSVKPQGRSLIVKFSAPAKGISSGASAAASTQSISSAKPSEAAMEMKAAPPAEKAPEKAIEKQAEKIVEKSPEKPADTRRAEKKQLTGKTQLRPIGADIPETPSKLKWMFALIMVFGGAFLSLRLALSRRKGKKKANAAEGRLVAWTKRVLGAKLGSTPDLVEVISTHPIGPKKNILVVRVREKTLVLAVADDSISFLSELDGEEIYEEGQAPALARKSEAFAQGDENRASRKSGAGFNFMGFLRDAKRKPEAPRAEPVFESPRSKAAVTANQGVNPASMTSPTSPETEIAPVDAALGITPAARTELGSFLPTSSSTYAALPATTATAPAGARQNIRQRLQGLKEL